MIFFDYTAEEVRWHIITHADRYPEVKGIETDISWLHIDARNVEALMIFKP